MPMIRKPVVSQPQLDAETNARTSKDAALEQKNTGQDAAIAAHDAKDALLEQKNAAQDAADALNAANDAANKTAQKGIDDRQDADDLKRDNALAGLRQRAIQVKIPADGSYVWTFNPPFPANVVPVISALVQAPKGAAVPYDAQIDGEATNTSVTIKVIKAAVANIPVIGAVPVPLFTTPGVIWVHLTAQEPTS